MSECKLQSVFASGSDSPADLLAHAAAVTKFLAEVSGFFSGDGPTCGLSADGCFGLACVLNGVENTINEALIRL